MGAIQFNIPGFKVRWMTLRAISARPWRVNAVPETLNVTDDMVARQLGVGVTLASACAAGRVYYVDCTVLQYFNAWQGGC